MVKNSSMGTARYEREKDEREVYEFGGCGTVAGNASASGFEDFRIASMRVASLTQYQFLSLCEGTHHRPGKTAKLTRFVLRNWPWNGERPR